MGIAYELFDEPESRLEDFSCAICFEVYQKPVRVCTQEHIYCYECVQRLASMSCPECRQPIGATVVLAKDLARKINCLKRKCENVTVGCEHFGQDVEEHEKKHCAYRKLDCPEQCGAKVRRNEVYHHHETCTMAIIKCTNWDHGCTSRVLRRDEPAHLAICEGHPCLNQAEGCRYTGSVAKVAAHMEGCSILYWQMEALKEEIANVRQINLATAALLVEKDKALQNTLSKVENITSSYNAAMTRLEEATASERTHKKAFAQLTAAHKRHHKIHSETKEKLAEALKAANNRIREVEGRLRDQSIRNALQGVTGGASMAEEERWKEVTVGTILRSVAAGLGKRTPMSAPNTPLRPITNRQPSSASPAKRTLAIGVAGKEIRMEEM